MDRRDRKSKEQRNLKMRLFLFGKNVSGLHDAAGGGGARGGQDHGRTLAPSLVRASLTKKNCYQLPGASADGTATTYCIMREDHTLGNLLRWMIMKK